MSSRRDRRHARRTGRAHPSTLPAAQPTALPRGLSRSDLGWGAALLAMTLLAYFPALRDGFIWDDNHYVTENIVLRSLDGLWRLWLEPQSVPQYYPVTFTSFW